MGESEGEVENKYQYPKSRHYMMAYCNYGEILDGVLLLCLALQYNGFVFDCLNVFKLI